MKSLIGIVLVAAILKLVVTPELAAYMLLALILMLFAIMLDRIFQH